MTVFYILMAILLSLGGELLGESVVLSLFIIKNVILKTLFPMMVLMRLIARSRPVLRLTERVGRWRLWRRMELSDALLPTVIAGMLTGFPTSATDIGRLTREGKISEGEAGRALALSSLPSPAFVILVAWDNAVSGAIRYLFLIVCAVVFSSLFESKRTEGRGDVTPLTLPRAISESATAVVGISGTIIFFNALTTVLSRLFPPLTFFFSTVLEMTSGVAGAGEHSVLKALSVGWSGVSALTQVRTLAPEVSPVPYIVTRAFSAIALSMFEYSPILALIFLIIIVNIAKIHKKSQKTLVKKRIWLYNKV